MSILQQSSKAQDRTLGAWFSHIDNGAIRLPRFQRFEAWDRKRITSFLNTLINNLPVGVALVLEVAGTEKFVSRHINTAERNGGTVTQNLLDGQQRLTAFWRTMHDNYGSESFFIYFPQYDPQRPSTEEEPEVICIPRWINKHGLLMPKWAEQPAKCLDRGLIPLSLLRPGDMGHQVDNWLDEATKPDEPGEDDVDALRRYREYSARKSRIKADIISLRERVTHFNLPYLSLPADTSKDVALQVFINMNTNSKPLSIYDIIVAEVESATGKSLHDLQDQIQERHSDVAHFGDLSDLILSTSALLQDKLPNTRGELEMDKVSMLKKWPILDRCLERMASFLASQGIFDEERLPTNAVVPVIAACYELIPDDGDLSALGESLLRRYLWSSFFTDRYENTAASRAFADFKALKLLLSEGGYDEAKLSTVPALNRQEFPLAEVDSLLAAGWPKQAGITARGILAVSTYFGACDFADNQPASYKNNKRREYHHVFPTALLDEAETNGYLALNCAFITWKTNRIIGRKDPIDYLHERIEWAGEEAVKYRMKSHLIDFDLLKKASYVGKSGEGLAKGLKDDFYNFLRARANLVHHAATSLADGKPVTLESVFDSQEIVSTSDQE